MQRRLRPSQTLGLDRVAPGRVVAAPGLNGDLQAAYAIVRRERL
jgi:hypothetical protein